MLMCIFFFFFNDTATTEIYTLSLHDALPIFIQRSHSGGSMAAGRSQNPRRSKGVLLGPVSRCGGDCSPTADFPKRSEEQTSELQSRQYLVCRLLLEKKKKNILTYTLADSSCT